MEFVKITKRYLVDRFILYDLNQSIQNQLTDF